MNRICENCAKRFKTEPTDQKPIWEGNYCLHCKSAKCVHAQYINNLVKAAYERGKSEMKLEGYVQPKADCDHPTKGLKVIDGFLCGYCGTIWNDRKRKLKL